MTYTVLATKRVDKKLNRLHRFDQKKVFKILTLLKTGPFPDGTNIAKMEKSGKSYRIRTGDIRIIYVYDPQSKEITVIDVGYRGSVYKGH